MHIDEIQNGIVIDHIKAGKGMELYHFLHLDELDCSVAILRNVNSQKMGKKDIIKIDSCLLYTSSPQLRSWRSCNADRCQRRIPAFLPENSR